MPFFEQRQKEPPSFSMNRTTLFRFVSFNPGLQQLPNASEAKWSK
jgi:hypothetical protein